MLVQFVQVHVCVFMHIVIKNPAYMYSFVVQSARHVCIALSLSLSLSL